ncbi:MAG: hypothetical protein GF330_04105 [Candidatus Eisenbacteria bacterium]|nr:hypothetical protein [Candidatus Eisenbacteria bacterium]
MRDHQFSCILRLATALALILASIPAAATTHVVAPDGSGDFPTIQAAIDAAADGDTVELTDGLFTGEGNRDLDYAGKALLLLSQSGDPDACVIDCEGSAADPHRGVQFRNGEPQGAQLRDVTIRGGWVSHPQVGSAIHCGDGCAPQIIGCVIATSAGSAVSCGNGSAPRFTDCDFTTNQGLYGGALHGEHCTLLLDGCTFRENVAEAVAGALFAYDADVGLTDCQFIGNTARREAAVTCTDFSTAQIEDCWFADNVASASGAALTFWLSGPNLVESCTFTGNRSAGEGAAIWSEKISDTEVRGCTFWGNASPDATVLAGNQRFVLENCVVAFAAEGPGVASHYDYAELSCCDVFGNAGGDWVGAIEDQLGQRGNICEDPLFCDPEAGDFQIDCLSPCAPFSPPNPECDRIGAWPVGCGGSPARVTSWGAVKAAFGR